MTLGEAYLSELHMPVDEREEFLQSMLARQGEPKLWLLLFKHEGRHWGFVHVKIDENERPGWGFILEFYVVPDKRRSGWGRKLSNLVAEILRNQGAEHIWLLAFEPSSSFWRSLGFRETGEIQDGKNVMIRSI